MKVALPFALFGTQSNANQLLGSYQSERLALDAAPRFIKDGYQVVLFKATKLVRPKEQPLLTEDIVIDDNGK